jgi:hypothetical protein
MNKILDLLTIFLREIGREPLHFLLGEDLPATDVTIKRVDAQVAKGTKHKVPTGERRNAHILTWRFGEKRTRDHLTTTG